MSPLEEQPASRWLDSLEGWTANISVEYDGLVAILSPLAARGLDTQERGLATISVEYKKVRH